MATGSIPLPRSFRALALAALAVSISAVASIAAIQALLERQFRGRVEQALRVRPEDGPIRYQIQKRIYESTEATIWARYLGLRVVPFVLGANGSSLYQPGTQPLPQALSSSGAAYREAAELLPASASVFVELPLTSPLAGGLLAVHAGALLGVLSRHSRGQQRAEAKRIAEAVASRNETAQRAEKIQAELDQVRARLSELEPAERAQGEEIRALEQERAQLQSKLAALALREAELRAEAARSSDLDRERQALEELLDEAVEDLNQRNADIQRLEESLKQAARAAPSPRSKSRAAEQLTRRFAVLYRNLDVDDRAIQDLIALGDDQNQLRAEEVLKKLCDAPDQAGIRRKVGGLPPHLSIFELGFAGKGRIYFTRSENGRYRILAIGAKNTQNADLDYLSRLP
jgi:DNA repair exonuclease SbcCD ATPase subunit